MTTAKDITGQRFGRLTAIRATALRVRKYVVWECACDCGTSINVPYRDLAVKGGTKSCGCLRMSDYTNRRFGRLVAIRPTGGRVGSFVVWECVCDCGNTHHTSSNNLHTGAVRSCGCLRREMTIARLTTHQMGGTPTHKSWSHMLYRCTNPRSRNWPNYGARGITVCDRWRTFENFLADMGERPPGTTIDRFPNNDGNYEPGNCRWATAKQQANNRRARLMRLSNT